METASGGKRSRRARAIQEAPCRILLVSCSRPTSNLADVLELAASLTSRVLCYPYRLANSLVCELITLSIPNGVSRKTSFPLAAAKSGPSGRPESSLRLGVLFCRCPLCAWFITSFLTSAGLLASGTLGSRDYCSAGTGTTNRNLSKN